MAETLRYGQRMELTAEGIRLGYQGAAATPRGTLVKLGKNGSIVVRRDGLRTSIRYARKFWRILKEE